MAEDKVIPSDILADANRLYPNAAHKYSLNSKLKGVYIQGRLDERAKSWTDDDMIAFSRYKPSQIKLTDKELLEEYKKKMDIR